MRKILFRGKRIGNGEWVYGVPVIAKDDIADKDIIVMVDNPNEIVPMEGLALFEKVDPETVGQYTGLTDKNGKKIFEGDIIFDPELKENHIVMFDEGGFCTEEMFLQFYLCFDEMEVEVIGNIHDNPELLEVTK